jgi:hypothetical protein
VQESVAATEPEQPEPPAQTEAFPTAGAHDPDPAADLLGPAGPAEDDAPGDEPF